MSTSQAYGGLSCIKFLSTEMTGLLIIASIRKFQAPTSAPAKANEAVIFYQIVVQAVIYPM